MSKHNFILLSLIFSLLFFSCDRKKEDDNSEKDLKTTITLEEMAKRHVEATLNIPHDENYTFSIHKKHLDNDTILDAIILVNRLNFALDEAAKSGNSAKAADLGFIGRYNSLFYFDGGLNKISPEIPLPSSAHSLLKLNFTSFSGNEYTDFTIDYKIRNSQFRNYYIVINHTPVRVFQWKVYDYLKEQNEESYYFEFERGSYSQVKDILIFKGVISNNKEVDDIYNFEPQIKKSGLELIHRFFFLDKEFKYFTNK